MCLCTTYIRLKFNTGYRIAIQTRKKRYRKAHNYSIRASPHGEAYTIIDTRKDLFAALVSQDVTQIEDILCDWLDETISYHDEKSSTTTASLQDFFQAQGILTEV